MAGSLKKTFTIETVDETPQLIGEAGAFNLVGWNLINQDQTACYLKLYNSATAGAVSVGTTPVVKTLYIPAGGTAFLSAEEEDLQDNFPLGIVVAVTTGVLFTDTGAPSTGAYVQLKYEGNR